MPSVVGQPQTQATGTLVAAGFAVQVQSQPTCDDVYNTNVVGQNPAGGQSAYVGSTVSIVVPRRLSARLCGDGPPGA